AGPLTGDREASGPPGLRALAPTRAAPTARLGDGAAGRSIYYAARSRSASCSITRGCGSGITPRVDCREWDVRFSAQLALHAHQPTEQRGQQQAPQEVEVQRLYQRRIEAESQGERVHGRGGGAGSGEAERVL